MRRADPLTRGVFTLSLDFELIWGTLDRHAGGRFRQACEVEREVVIDQLLALLAEFEISATWCTVGHLFLSSCSSGNGGKHPEIIRPAHAWIDDDWFAADPCGSEETDPTFYGASLIQRIRACAVPQEIGCHSFSHVIFGDPGCSRECASSELAECVRLARERNLTLRSFAFPRNRIGHLDVLRDHGFDCYRGTAPVWYERISGPAWLTRLGHLMDVLFARRPPVVFPELDPFGVWNIPASMMYFPMHGRRRHIPIGVRVHRARKGLERAAAEQGIFHLWFHPTNLADETERMFAGLRAIFNRVDQLRNERRLRVAPMGALVPTEGGGIPPPER